MRAALSLKASNGSAPNAENNKQAAKNAPVAGKLTRQIGTSNLRREVISIREADRKPLIEFNSKENFEVFEDPDPVTDVVTHIDNDENDADAIVFTTENVGVQDNNLINDLERKMEEKSHAEQLKIQFVQTRDNNDSFSRLSEPPSEMMSVSTGYDDDDFDKASVASSIFTTTVRASFSSIRVDSEPTVNLKRELVIRKKAEKDARDEAMFSSDEYFPDIIKYMMHRQLKTRPAPNYFTRQTQVNEEMRTILIDWFNDVVKEYNMKQETFHLACNLVDRVLSFLNVDKIQFQLVGTTSLMIAAKYEEIFPPEIQEFSIITDNTYGIEEILRMERFLLAKFDFVVGLPTAAWFGACFGKRMRFTHKMTKTMRYLVDLSLVDVHFLRYRPSDIAAAAACFANVQLGKEAWPKEIIEDTGIDTDDFVDVLKDLHHMYITASTSDYKSIFNKYCETDEKEVALVSAPTDKFRELFPTIFGAPRKIASK
ncbi:hypothetical protein GCK72_009356 [Caenorhabditis remanei]|uniref:Cyclin N-terminal domain-containing protein n=2 Tax=Caenorhabditis remanei TaxID=31234 RepID=E3LSN0_CAERE|nr:hypothetical protein GCK72_009356 [Caenorhabditis remanei]EFP09593.1 hypothetical protein CRE_25344 [Caenorhabditis remanei]KAF1761102.1 hypothetical protein GCK72_009356 [Caenorhabditis remanei]